MHTFVIKSISLGVKDLNYHRIPLRKFSTVRCPRRRSGLVFSTRRPPARPVRLGSRAAAPRARARGRGGECGAGPGSTQSAAEPAVALVTHCASLRPSAGRSRRCRPRELRAGRGKEEDSGPAGCPRAAGRGKGETEHAQPLRRRQGGGDPCARARAARRRPRVEGAVPRVSAAGGWAGWWQVPPGPPPQPPPGPGAPEPPEVMSWTPSGAAPAGCPSLRASRRDLGLPARPIPAARCCP